MSQTYSLIKHLHVTYAGIETTFGTVPSMTRIFPVAGTVDVSGLTQAELANEDETSLAFDMRNRVRGNKGGNVKFDYYLAPHGTQLTSGNAPVTHPVGILLKTIFGGEQTNSGSTATGTPTTGSVPVVTGQGSRFAAGQWALFTTTVGLQPARVTQLSTDTLSLWPYLSSAPASASAVVNGYTYYPTTQNALSLCLQHALVNSSDTNWQWTISGSTGDVSFKLDDKDLIKMSFDLKAADWTGPVNQSISTTTASDPMASPMAMVNAVALIQTPSTTTRVAYPVKGFGIKLDTGNTHVTEFGGIQGKTGVARMPAREFAELTVKIAADQAQDTNWSSQTDLSVVLMVPYGSGSTKRWIVLDAPLCQLVGKPKPGDESGFKTLDLTFKAKLDTSTTPNTGDLATAPFRIFIG